VPEPIDRPDSKKPGYCDFQSKGALKEKEIVPAEIDGRDDGQISQEFPEIIPIYFPFALCKDLPELDDREADTKKHRQFV
jgi:hypothetical protein